MAEVITLQQPGVSYRYSQFLPDIVRVLEAKHSLDDDFHTCNVATVVGDTFQATLTWMSRYNDPQICKGALARVYWPDELSEVDGRLPVVRLVPMTSADHGVNLFATIPTEWLKNAPLIERAKALWEQLSSPKQALFNALFWNAPRFQRYVCVPASSHEHHNGWGGLLRHAVEMAEHAEHIALEVPGVSCDLLILAALLYNAPIAEAFRWANGQWASPGESIIESARLRFATRLDDILEHQPTWLTEEERQILWQILFGQAGKANHPEQRPFAKLETEILFMADRLSSAINRREQGGVQ